MEIEQESKLDELRFLMGTYESADEFAELYERTLWEAKARNDFVTMRTMQQLLLQQFMFLFHLWRIEKGYIKGNDEEKGQ